jgi:hypothetical protein
VLQFEAMVVDRAVPDRRCRLIRACALKTALRGRDARRETRI